MKNILFGMTVFLFIAVTWCSANAVEVFQTTTELKQYNPDQAYNGYTLFTIVNPEGRQISCRPF